MHIDEAIARIEIRLWKTGGKHCHPCSDFEEETSIQVWRHKDRPDHVILADCTGASTGPASAVLAKLMECPVADECESEPSSEDYADGNNPWQITWDSLSNIMEDCSPEDRMEL